MVQNLPANAGDVADECLILGGEEPLEEGMATPLQCACLENPMHRGAWRATVHRVVQRDDTK